MFRFLGPRTRWHYWSCSKTADFIRGTKKPPSETMEGWENWRIKSKKKHPIRYWIAEDLLRHIQNFFCFPSDLCNAIRYYIRNRFITKTHYLKTGLKPGKYHEFDERILHGLFNELKDFVEIELSHLSRCNKSKKYKFKKGRSEEAGIDHLNWEISLTYGSDFHYEKNHKLYNEPTPQAKSAKEILELYNWWNNRENRPDPHDASGWSELYNSKNKKEKDTAFKKLQKIEDSYEKEDEKMLLKLIKIRKNLWT